jgi:hypothetical protein
LTLGAHFHNFTIFDRNSFIYEIIILHRVNFCIMNYKIHRFSLETGI